MSTRVSYYVVWQKEGEEGEIQSERPYENFEDARFGGRLKALQDGIVNVKIRKVDEKYSPSGWLFDPEGEIKTIKI